MMFGSTPFYMEGAKLVLEFKPALIQYLVGFQTQVECTFLGKIHVTYKFTKQGAVAPGAYSVVSYDIAYMDRTIRQVLGSKIMSSLLKIFML